MRALLSLVIAAVVGVTAGPVYADTITLDLTIPNSALSGFPPPYATVTVNRTDPMHAMITFTGSTSGGFTYRMGAAQAVDVNINASSFSISAVTPGTLSFSGAGNVDGFGNFNATFDNDDGFSRSFTSASFTVTASGASWASASNVLVDNSNGFRAAAHIFVTGAQCGNGACATGFAANGPSHVVPEPATLLLVGGGLFGVGASAWKRRRR